MSIHLNQSTAVEDITLFKDLNLYDNAVTVIVTVINNLGNINKSDFEFPSHICRGGGGQHNLLAVHSIAGEQFPKLYRVT